MKKYFIVIIITFIATLICNNKVSAQKIGPANGTTYEVVSISYEWRACGSCCGFNDALIPNQAKYKIENRKYHQFNNEGKEVRSWYQSVEIGFTGDCRETG